MSDLIVFPGSPWPGGHAIAELAWTARLEPDTGLWFDLHLVSDPYPDVDTPEGDDEDADEGPDAWNEPFVWANYHRCTLSSTFWGHEGFLAATASAPLDTTSPMEFTVDDYAGPQDEPDTDEEMAFGIYLLGHDNAAHHRIRLTPVTPTAVSLDWRGRIALRYVNSTAPFRHEFRATAAHVPLSKITYPAALTTAEAEALLATVVQNPQTLKPLLKP
jgi:hypothetical protein